MGGANWTEDLPISEADVRTYLGIEGTTGKYASSRIGSNIRAAASFLQRETHRQFMREDATKVFTTNGEAYIALPDFRSISSASLQSVALVADSTFYKIPDALHSGVYVGIQFRAFGHRGSSYLSNPEWFDRNLDQPSAWGRSSLPNDLSVVAAWGWSPYPWEFLQTVAVLAGFYTKRPDSILANVAITPEGNVLTYSQLPVEVGEFIRSWMGGPQMVTIND